MALSKQWYSRGNIPVPDNSTTALLAKAILWCLKAALLDEIATGTLGPEGAMPAGGKWTVEGSSNSVAAGMDAVDRWTSAFDGTKIVRANAGVAHSWIVLKSPAGIATGGPYYFCIDYSGASDQQALFYFSRNAFTGGTITARPTATKEWNCVSGNTFCESSTQAHRFHKSMDANGNFHMEVSRNNAAIFNFLLGGMALTDTVSGDLAPWYSLAMMSTGSTGAGQIASMQAIARSADDSGNTTTGGLGNMAFGGVAMGSTLTANVLNGAFDALPVYVAAMGPAGKHGVRGTLPDCAQVGVAVVGATEPPTGTIERMVIGNMLFPSSVSPNL